MTPSIVSAVPRILISNSTPTQADDGSKQFVEASNANWLDLIEQMNEKRIALEFTDLKAKAEKFSKGK